MADASASIAAVFSEALRRHRQGRFAAALDLYQQVLRLDPSHAEALHGLGILARRAGRPGEAVGLIRRAVASRPNVAEYHTNLGNALHDSGRFEEAAQAHREAIRLRPGLAQAHNNLGNALWAVGLREEALDSIRAAVALDPSSAESLTNLGNGLRDVGRSDEAIAAQRAAIGLRPDIAELHLNLGNTLALVGEIDAAVECYRRTTALLPTSASMHSQLLLTLLYQPSCTPEVLREELARWNAVHAEPLRDAVVAHRNGCDPGRRLRIGYVGSFFCSHVCATFLEPLLSHHDASEFEITCYSGVARPDDVTRRFMESAARWRDVGGLRDADLAGLVRADEIDILVDLHLHTSDNRLPVFARRPAPVQVTWLGYPGTAGMLAMDYRFTDPYLDPPGSDSDQSGYSEQSVALETFWCYGPNGTEPEVNAPPALAQGCVTFGCLNNYCKVNPGVLELWAAVLRACPGSRLLILSEPGRHRLRALDLLGRHGVDPGRVSFEPRRPRREYMELYHRIDVALDTFPYAGHTTTLDATWMGVPVVTLAGHTVVGRGGVSILSNTGVPELIARTPEEYVRIAVDLANNLERVAEYRRSLRPRMAAGVTTDAPRFAKTVERAYRRMWERWCMTQPSSAAKTETGVRLLR